MMLLSAAVQLFLFYFKSAASGTKMVELSARMATDSEGTSEKRQYKENKEYLSGLYIDSTLRNNWKISASVESMQLL